MCRLQAGVSYEIPSLSAEARKIHHLYAPVTNSVCLGVTTLIRSLPSHCWPQHFHFRHDKRARVWPSPLAPSLTLTPVLGLWKSFPALPFFVGWGSNLADASCRHVPLRPHRPYPSWSQTQLLLLSPVALLLPPKAVPKERHKTLSFTYNVVPGANGTRLFDGNETGRIACLVAHTGPNRSKLVMGNSIFLFSQSSLIHFALCKKIMNINNSQTTTSAVITVRNRVTCFSWWKNLSQRRNCDWSRVRKIALDFWTIHTGFAHHLSEANRNCGSASLGHCESTFLYESLGNVISTFEILGEERLSEI